MIHIKLLIMAVLWGGGFIVAKIASAYAGPFTISFVRFAIATGVLMALMSATGRKLRFNKTLIVPVLCTAFIGVLCYSYFFIEGIKFIEAGRGSVIVSTVPIAVMVFSAIFLKERIGFLKLAGIMLSVAGAWVVISQGDISTILLTKIGRGDIYMLGCVICAAGFALFSKKILSQLSPLETMLSITTAGTALLFIPAIIELISTPIIFAAPLGWSLIYLAVGPSVVAVIFYYQGINQVGPSKASQYMNFMPVFAVLIAFVFLGEHITGSLLVGGGLVTTGLYLTNI